MFLVYNVSVTGLYLHLPFCAQKCHYCDFVVTTSKSPALRERFFSALEREAGRAAPSFEAKPFETLYLGGGTPSLLSLEALERLFKLLRGHFQFAPSPEITFEVNPGDLEPVKARFLKDHGVNRISLGVQSFHSETLKQLHRSHDASAIERSFFLLRDAGFNNISFDLMLSLPGEDLGRVEHSLKKLIELDPEHVSLYELTVEEKTVFGSLRKAGKLSLPGEEETLKMLSYAREYLKNQGYLHYELLSYAKKGRESRHNLIYWANEEYLGLGPGAFSYLGGRRFRSSASVEEYLQKMERGDWTAFEEETLTSEKKTVESLLLALRLSEGADLGRFTSLPEGVSQSIQALEEKGLLSQDNRRLRLTPRGQFFAETVFTELSSI